MTSAMPDKQRFSGLGIRILSGLILAPLMIAIIVTGGFWFTGLMALSALVALCEWYGMSKAGPKPFATLLLGFIYLIISYCSYIFMRFGFEAGAWLALAAMLCVWASDIGAYFAGKFIGGPKMAPKLSPKKTWAGLGGSMVSCGLMLVGCLYAGPQLQAHLNTDIGITFAQGWLPVFIVGTLLGIVGQAGDIFISFFKRRAHLKDTGHLIPGHGGLLDRIDALLLVAPVFFILCWVFLK